MRKISELEIRPKPVKRIRFRIKDGILFFSVSGLAFLFLIGAPAMGSEMIRVLHLESTEPGRSPLEPVEPLPAASRSPEGIFTGILELRDELELTEDQVHHIRSKRLEMRKKRVLTEAELEIAQLDLQDASHSLNASEADLKAHADKVRQLQGTLLDMELKGWHFLREILTPDQKARLERYSSNH